MNPGENRVAFMWIMKHFSVIEDCPLPASDVEFHAIVRDDEYFDMPNPRDVIRTVWSQASSFKIGVFDRI